MDIDPQDLDPETGQPYAGYSSPALDTSFHDHEMAVDDSAIVRDLKIGALARVAAGNPGGALAWLAVELARFDDWPAYFDAPSLAAAIDHVRRGDDQALKGWIRGLKPTARP